MFGWLKSKNKKADLPKSAIVQPIVVKTQAEQDIELMASDDWKNQLTEANEIWHARFEKIDKIITNLQESQSNLKLFLCAEFFQVNVKLNNSVLEPTYKDNFFAKIKEILSIEKYKIHMLKKIEKHSINYNRPIEYYIDEFIILRNHFLEGVIGVFDNYMTNSKIVLNDINELNKVFQILRPVSNEKGRLAWCAHMRSYASRKLQGVSMIGFYPNDLPPYKNIYFTYNIPNQFHHADRNFAMQLYATILHFEKITQNNTQANTTSIGIEFENNLREALLAEISDVVVETTPVTGDHGADLLIRVGSVRIAIQAKRYTGVVGNAAVQEIFAAKQFYDADFAMVVTTSHYTNPAKVLAEKLEVTLATENDFIQKIRYLLN